MSLRCQHFLFNFKTQGHGYQYLFPNSVWLQNEGWFVIPSLGGVTLSFFTLHYLDLEKNNPVFYKIVKSFVYIFMAIFFFPFLKPLYYELSNLTYIILILGLMTILTIAGIRLKQGFKPAKYFLLF